MTTVGPFTFEEYLEEVRRFHSYPAPGVILGGFMVEAARERMPSDILYNAVSETPFCLPDAIQLLTPCTIGNGWLSVLRIGRFALALYQKETGEGVRVSLDHGKLEAFAELKSWFLKLKPKGCHKEDLLLREIREAGPLILKVLTVRVNVELLRLPKKKRLAICPSCGESYPEEHGSPCLGCRGQSPYLP
jgi:formylmethanofuran dehydrogenase subunit E